MKLILSIICLLVSSSVYAQQVVLLYGDSVPNSIPSKIQEATSESGGIKRVGQVTNPSMNVYMPEKGKSNGSAVIIFPGGGYQYEAYEIEGTWIAEAFVKHGTTGIVVRYRLPSDSTMRDKSIGPVQDAQQAVKVVRQHAIEWNLDTTKIGIMGFSAGGHLASTAGTHFDTAFVPNEENINLRPDFMILIYPVISMTDKLTHAGSRKALLGDNPSQSQIDFFSNELHVTDQTPPTYLMHAGDDKTVDPDNSISFYEALRHHNVPAELVVIPKGGHGFAARFKPEDWMDPLFSWMKSNGWMK